MSGDFKKVLQTIAWIMLAPFLAVFVGFEVIVHFTGLPDKFPDGFWPIAIVFAGICFIILTSIWLSFQLTSIREWWHQTPSKYKSIPGKYSAESYPQMDKVQRICRQIMICGVCLMVGGRICSILIGVRSKRLDYVTLVVVLVGLLAFFSGYYISNQHAKGLNAFEQNPNEILKQCSSIISRPGRRQ